LGPIQIHYINLTEFLLRKDPNPKLIPIVTNFQAEYYVSLGGPQRNAKYSKKKIFLNKISFRPQYITNENRIFQFLTNRNAPNWKIVGINFENPQEAHWTEIMREDPKFVLEWAVPVNK